MRTLIINGSPRTGGDTAALVGELKERLGGEFFEISAYRDKVSPCVDCRACWKKPGCVIDDDMRLVYDDGYDNVVIASPVYMSTLPGPLVGLASRFQAYYAGRRFLGYVPERRRKMAGLILTGGGDGSPDEAIRLAGWMLKQMNAVGFEENRVLSLNTDALPAANDEKAMSAVRDMARRFREAYGRI